MNRWMIVFGGFVIVVASCFVLVIIPYFSIVRSTPAHYKEAVLSEELKRGRQVYIELGCVYCHSQQPRSASFAPDGLRGWGRQAFAHEYAGQRPHLLGTMRTGPDLLNIGDRNPSEQWNLIHLYNPRWVVPWSIMPAFPYLFEEKTQLEEGDVALDLKNIGVDHHSLIVAKPEALDLVAYLRSLKQEEESNDAKR